MNFSFQGNLYDYEMIYENGYFEITAQSIDNQIITTITHLDFIHQILEVDASNPIFQQKKWQIPEKQADKLVDKVMKLVYKAHLVEELEKILNEIAHTS